MDTCGTWRLHRMVPLTAPVPMTVCEVGVLYCVSCCIVLQQAPPTAPVPTTEPCAAGRPTLPLPKHTCTHVCIHMYRYIHICIHIYIDAVCICRYHPHLADRPFRFEKLISTRASGRLVLFVRIEIARRTESARGDAGGERQGKRGHALSVSMSASSESWHVTWRCTWARMNRQKRSIHTRTHHCNHKHIGAVRGSTHRSRRVLPRLHARGRTHGASERERDAS